MVCVALRRHGFTVESAQDGIEALAMLQTGAYDLLVLDLMMPRLDGFGVLQKIDDAAGQHPKILILTAAVPSILEQLPRERVNAVLTKPFDIAALIATARAVAGDASGISD